MNWRKWLPSITLIFVLVILAWMIPSKGAEAGPPAQTEPGAEGTFGIYRGLSEVVKFDISPALRDIPAVEIDKQEITEIPERPTGLEGPLGPQDADPVVQSSKGPDLIPTPIVSFDGPTNIANVSPPDPVGDVGPNHYVAMSNLYFAVYNKTGTLLLGPLANNTLWAGFGGDCETDNSGDPIVVYDQLADRWILTQFTSSGPTYFNCVAVSTSPDPTSTYYRYAFSSGANFPDYPKYGVWPDALYISTREFAGGFAGIGAYAVDRAQLIAGNPAPTVISFLVPPGATSYNIGDGLLPTDMDGSALPPAGSPNYFVGSMDDGGPYGAPQDALTIWEFAADFVTPGNSTFTLANTVPVAPFDSMFPCSPGSRDCIPQPGTTNKVDVLSYRQRPLWRLAYRNFGSHESLVTNQAVEAAPNMAGVRWYEIRDPNGTPTIYQQGTYAPGVSDGIHRWMGSIAMDQTGNMALGYSASDATNTYPSSWYTGRLVGDPLGTMPQGEGSIITGTGSQTGSQRWGDYTSMNVDPVDDCTFWYVNEYLPVTSSVGWVLRIGSFRFPTCGQLPSIDLTKTVGTDPNVCATTDTINVLFGSDVSYCYEVTNTGTLTLTLHDLVDNELPSPILSSFPYTLTPGSSIFLTQTVNITQTTINTATWTAYNPGPTDVVTATDTATVNIINLPDIVVDPASLASSLYLSQTVTQTLSISNLGTADLEWEIIEAEPTVVSIPASNAGFPQGDHLPSAGAVPGAAAHELAPPTSVLFPLDSAAYGLEAVNGFYTIFGIDRPEILPNIAPFPGTGNFIGAGEYVDGLVYMIDGAYNMWELDPAIGAILNTYTATTPLGGETYAGLAYDPTDGTVYASSTSIASASLFTMDVTTGNATLVGPITGAPCVIGLAVDGAGALWGHDICSDVLVSINKTTGAATTIGSIGFDANFGQGLGWDAATDTLYMAAFNSGTFQPELRAVDRITGNTTFLGVLGSLIPGSLAQVSWLGFDLGGGICSPGDIPWASVDPITGTVPAGMSTLVDVTFDSTGLSTGVYTGTLCVNSNDPFNLQVPVPLTMTVELAPARLQVAHLAPFAMDPGTAVTVTLNGTPVLTDFAYTDSTIYLDVTQGTYLVEIFPGGSPTPAITGTVDLMSGVEYTAIAIGDGVNQPLSLLALVDDNTAPAPGNFKLRLGHLAPFANTLAGTTADVRLDDGTAVLTDVVFGAVAPYIELPAGTYDLKITTPGGGATLINLAPVTFTAGQILSAFATGDGVNQPLGGYALPSDQLGFVLPLESYMVYLPIVPKLAP